MCWVLISANTYVLTIWSKYRTLSLPHKSHYAWSSQSRSIIVLRKYFSDFCNYNFSLPCNLYTWNNIICQFHSSSSRNFCYGEEWYLSAACPASGSYSPGRRVPLPWFISGSGTRQWENIPIVRRPPFIVQISQSQAVCPGPGRSPGEGNGHSPVFLPGKFHGQRSLAGYSPWGHKESDMTEWLYTHTHTHTHTHLPHLRCKF